MFCLRRMNGTSAETQAEGRRSSQHEKGNRRDDRNKRAELKISVGCRLFLPRRLEPPQSIFIRSPLIRGEADGS